MHSCIYEGFVVHRRHRPIEHAFRYRLYMAYLDLNELPKLYDKSIGLSRHRWAPLSFLQRDHLGGSSESLDEGVRQLVADRTGVRPVGPIRLLTQLRNFSYYFSPLNMYYCFDEAGQRVETIVAEVSNTPWREQHRYVLWDGNRLESSRRHRYRHAKDFHVSPFLDMEFDYDWRLSEPRTRLGLQITNLRQGERFFDASMVLTRRPLDRAHLRRMCVRYPLMTARIVAAIHYQALKLWWKKCPVYPHPKKQVSLETS